MTRGETIPVKTTEGHHFRRVSIQRHVLAEAGIDPVEAMKLGPLYQALREKSESLGLLDGGRRRRPPINVSSGNGFVFINHVGQVTPSGFLEVPAGNVRDSSIVRISTGTRSCSPGSAAPTSSKVSVAAASTTQFAAVRVPRAYNSTGNIYAEEPLCVYEPGTFPLADEVSALFRANAPHQR